MGKYSIRSLVSFIVVLIVQIILCTATEAQQSQVWPIAIVFTRSADELAYKGTVNNPTLPQVLSQVRTAGVSLGHDRPSADAEIWLCKDGGIVGIWYSSRRGIFGYIADGSSQEGYKDDGKIGRLITQAQPIQRKVRQRPQEIAIADWVHSEPANLSQLVVASSTIAVGQAVGVLRMAHTPVNSQFDMQHTVYLFVVEDYLKESKAIGTNPVLKIWQEGGDLTWISAVGGPGGRGWEVLGDPMLNLGDRYCLFLRQQPAPSGNVAKPGDVEAMNNGIVGKAAELDELIAASPSVGKLLLRHNEVLPASTADPIRVLQTKSAGLSGFYGYSEQELVDTVRRLVVVSKDVHQGQGRQPL